MSCTLEEKVLKIKKSKTTAYVTIYILTTCHRLTGADKILGMVRKTFSFMNKDMLQQLLNLKVHIYTLYPIYSSDNATETSRHGLRSLLSITILVHDFTKVDFGRV